MTRDYVTEHVAEVRDPLNHTTTFEYNEKVALYCYRIPAAWIKIPLPDDADAAGPNTAPLGKRK